MNNQISTWRNPEIKVYNVKELLKKISVRAWSNDNDLCSYDVLSEGYGETEGGGGGLGGNETVCLEYGPLGGCVESLFCRYDVILR